MLQAVAWLSLGVVNQSKGSPKLCWWLPPHLLVFMKCRPLFCSRSQLLQVGGGSSQWSLYFIGQTKKKVREGSKMK